MNGLNVAQLIVNLVAVLLVLTPLLVLAYIAGRRSRMSGRVDELERLRPDVLLNGTAWQAAFDGDDSSSPQQTTIVRWQQVGSRITAESVFADGTRLSFEGVLHHRQLCFVALDRSRREAGLGAVLVDVRPGDDQMIGMRARWSPQSQTLLLRKVTFNKLNSDDSRVRPDVPK